MTQIPDNIASKIIGAYKIMNESSKPNEVAVATEMVQKLLQKYNISIDMLISRDTENKVIEQTLPMGSVNRDTFLGRLANILGKYNFVKVIWTYTPIRSGDFILGQTPALTFIGLPQNVNEVVKLFQSLSFRLRFIADEEFDKYQLAAMRQGIKSKHGKGWKSDYLMGVTDGIENQLKSQQEQFKSEEYQRQDGQVVTGNELVIVRGSEIEKYLDEHYPKLTRGKTIKKKINYSAYQNGLERGNNLNIRQNEIGGPK